MFDRLRNYINDNEFKINIYKNYIHIDNYEKLIILEEEYILLKSKTNKISIRGEKLELNKILDKELLIKGKIKSVEVSDE